ncbi:hypothetical protein BDR07DRAFT_1380858 [Suillus spraguei]|nr:hypothetical protein BDR07DRAFT_1380858 [Suillus spraguei]
MWGTIITLENTGVCSALATCKPTSRTRSGNKAILPLNSNSACALFEDGKFNGHKKGKQKDDKDDTKLEAHIVKILSFAYLVICTIATDVYTGGGMLLWTPSFWIRDTENPSIDTHDEDGMINHAAPRLYLRREHEAEKVTVPRKTA